MNNLEFLLGRKVHSTAHELGANIQELLVVGSLSLWRVESLLRWDWLYYGGQACLHLRNTFVDLLYTIYQHGRPFADGDPADYAPTE